MTIPVLTTKLYPPPLRDNHLQRTRLLEKLYLQNASCKLTLVSAPAGFGKTTLIRDWAHAQDRVLVWYQLDKSDSDPARFIAHLLMGIRQHASDFDLDLSDLLQGGILPPVHDIFTALINALASLDINLILVLDDYHLLESTYLNEGLSFFVEHQPPQLHLVIITREDPDLPLARLRAQGQVNEIRTAQLRFTFDEVMTFLDDRMGLSLDRQLIQHLDERTEGWIAGLQLAGLSLLGRDNISNRIQSLRGNDRYIMEYLTSEVLEGLDSDIQAFLLKTSILDQLSAPICNALLDIENSQSLLDHIDNANLFLVPMDNHREAYRYHHLFAELLRHQLEARYGVGEILALHQIASQYYQINGDMLSAIHHVLLVSDYERAADLLTDYRMTLLQTGEWFTMGRLVSQLPEALVQSRLALAVTRSWEMLASAQMNELVDYLSHITQRLDDPHLMSEVSILQGYVMLWQNKPHQAIEHSKHALENLTLDNDFLLSFAHNNLGFAYRAANQLSDALDVFREVDRRFGDRHDIVHLRVTVNAIANIHIMQGDLRQAKQVYESVLERYATSGFPQRMMGLLYIGLATIYYEWNELERAEQALIQAYAGWGKSELAKEVMHGHLHLAFVYQAQGRPDKARQEMQIARDLSKLIIEEVFSLYINAYQARLDLLQGRWTAVEAWANHLSLNVDNPQINDFTEYAYMTLARWWLKDNKSATLQQVQFILQPMLELADETERTALKAEASLLHAILAKTFGERALAIEYLITSLDAGQQFIRLYLNEADSIQDLLETIATRKDLPTAMVHHANNLLSAMPQTHAQTASTELIEPLTDRELDVLRELAEGNSNRQIAEKLYVSVGTVKTHARHIYEKLSVNNRTHAVARARELGIL